MVVAGVFTEMKAMIIANLSVWPVYICGYTVVHNLLINNPYVLSEADNH